MIKYGIADLCGGNFVCIDEGTSGQIRMRADMHSEDPHRFPTLTDGFLPEIEDKQKYFVGSQNFLFVNFPADWFWLWTYYSSPNRKTIRRVINIREIILSTN